MTALWLAAFDRLAELLRRDPIDVKVTQPHPIEYLALPGTSYARIERSRNRT